MKAVVYVIVQSVIAGGKAGAFTLDVRPVVSEIVLTKTWENYE